MESRTMRHTLTSFQPFHWTCLPAVILLAAPAAAQQPGQKTFASPEEACQALFQAAQGNDEIALLEIFGPEGKTIVASGDDAEDAASRANFVQRYQEVHRLVREPDGSTTLYIGPHNWPTPVPLMAKGKAWFFDTAAGRREILYRRIGQNEASTQRVCLELVAAQKEFFAAGRHEFARALTSSAGQHDGLHWQAAEGEPPSPIGPLVAAAAPPQGLEGAATPYRGYFFRVLTRQGGKAPGGAHSYLVDGRMTRGFAFVAYPALYRSSGVMTFVVNQDGVVRQKDLGPKTAQLATRVQAYNPDSSWKPASVETTP
jgi:hypothetical protein